MFTVEKYPSPLTAMVTGWLALVMPPCPDEPGASILSSRPGYDRQNEGARSWPTSRQPRLSVLFFYMPARVHIPGLNRRDREQSPPSVQQSRCPIGPA